MQDEFLPSCILVVFEGVIVINSIQPSGRQSEMSRRESRRDAVRKQDERYHVVLEDVLFDPLHDSLRRQSIASNIVAAFIDTCKDTTNLACVDLWLDVFNNLLASLLSSNGGAATILLSKYHFLNSLIAQARSRGDLKARRECLQRKLDACKTIFSSIITLVMCVRFLGGIRLRGNKNPGSLHLHGWPKRECTLTSWAHAWPSHKYHLSHVNEQQKSEETYYCLLQQGIESVAWQGLQREIFEDSPKQVCCPETSCRRSPPWSSTRHQLAKQGLWGHDSCQGCLTLSCFDGVHPIPNHGLQNKGTKTRQLEEQTTWDPR